MTTTTPPRPALLPGFTADTWQGRDDEPPYRVLYGELRTLTDIGIIAGTDAAISPAVIQFADGTIDTTGAIEPPNAAVAITGPNDRLDSAGLRQLAAALLNAADELDALVATQAGSGT